MAGAVLPRARRRASTCLILRFTSLSSAIIASNSARKGFDFTALRAEVALPANVRGPVDLVHGCQPRIAAACRARRSSLQPHAFPSLIASSNSSKKNLAILTNQRPTGDGYRNPYRILSPT